MQISNRWPFEIRAVMDGERSFLEGYAAKFNHMSVDMGGWFERIAPGAFRKSLESKGHDILMLWSHDHSKPLAARSDQSLEVWEDDVGLGFRAKVDGDTSWEEDAMKAVKKQRVRQMSFGFFTPEDGDVWERTGGKIVRTVLEADLWEISPVAMPAYPSTSVEARNLIRDPNDRFKQFLADEARALEAANTLATARFRFARAKNEQRRIR